MNNDNKIVVLNENGVRAEYGRVPDLWHVAMAVADNHIDKRYTDADRAQASKLILEVWHMAHDLKSVIEQQGQARLIIDGQPASMVYTKASQPAQFVDYAEIAKRVRATARQCIASARSRGGYYKHRGIELIAVDSKGERAGQGGEPVEFFEVDTISGKAIREALEHHAPEDMATWCLQGGIDAYESFQDAMQYPDDYEPMVDTWEVDPAPVAERGAA